MGNSGPAMLHKNEMVLHPHISQFVQNAAKSSDESGTGQGGSHFHYSVGNINTIDFNGVADVLKEHDELMFTMWKQQMPERNAAT